MLLRRISPPAVDSKHSNKQKQKEKQDSGQPVSLCTGDLQKGECYANMDYIIMSGTTSLGLQNIFVSYDITCQWNINFTTQNVEMPANQHLWEGVSLLCGVPKLHAKAHKLPSWSMKEMGPGSRHNTLDDHFSYHNFIKMISLGNMLHRWLVEAEIQVEAHRKYHVDFTNALPKPEYKTEWMAVVEEWDHDRSKPTPYLLVGKLKLLTVIHLVYEGQSVVYMLGIVLQIEQRREAATGTIKAEDDKL
ncbi:hypothetical protein ARMGADRAFT_1038929 [Armillaria gallica]|uniref:Uncharacterized protein n=1 Tax=Armillaria gallica TaxID=47427 RepID=A0A2H3D3F4_ARMGA|nr:hypothetical protein ARMGADRAFT_1038929 [Armillaria gallica]